MRSILGPVSVWRLAFDGRDELLLVRVCPITVEPELVPATVNAGGRRRPGLGLMNPSE